MLESFRLGIIYGTTLSFDCFFGSFLVRDISVNPLTNMSRKRAKLVLESTAEADDEDPLEWEEDEDGGCQKEDEEEALEDEEGQAEKTNKKRTYQSVFRGKVLPCIIRKCELKKLSPYRHRIPADDWRRQRWEAACDMMFSEADLRKNVKLCGGHFKTDDYERDMKAELMGHRRPKVMLKFNAVPSIFCLADYDPATNKCFEESPADGTSVRSSTAGAPSGVGKQGQCNNRQCAEEKSDLTAAKAKLEKANDKLRSRLATLEAVCREQQDQLLAFLQAKGLVDESTKTVSFQ